MKRGSEILGEGRTRKEFARRRGARGLFNSYMLQAGRTKFLAPGEVTRLVLEAKKGNKAAEAKIVNSHLLLVVGIARDFMRTRRPKSLDIMDLIQIGNMALYDAIKGFDAGRPSQKNPCPFKTYARMIIKRNILSEYRKHDATVRIPNYRQEQRAKIERTITELKMRGKNASVEDIAKIVRLKPREVAMFLGDSNVSVPLEATPGRKSGPIDFIRANVSGFDEIEKSNVRHELLPVVMNALRTIDTATGQNKSKLERNKLIWYERNIGEKNWIPSGKNTV